MKIFDFRFRPNTKVILDGIANSSMFKASCEASGFDKRVAQTLPEIVDDLKKRDVFGCVITGRDCRTTYGFPDNNGSVLEFYQAYPDFFYGFWGIDPHRAVYARVIGVIVDLTRSQQRGRTYRYTVYYTHIRLSVSPDNGPQHGYTPQGYDRRTRSKCNICKIFPRTAAAGRT